ncbi:MAG: acyl carrier protein [Clostridiales bacterium]|jgi:acyl carrier protein|nr:acyl carrier protein [Clostridiales bacterium]
MRGQIKEFLEQRFELEFDGDLGFDTDLFDGGFIDSLESLVIINYIEKEFKIKISPNDLIGNPFNSLNDIADFVDMKMKG